MKTDEELVFKMKANEVAALEKQIDKEVDLSRKKYYDCFLNENYVVRVLQRKNRRRRNN